MHFHIRTQANVTQFSEQRLLKLRPRPEAAPQPQDVPDAVNQDRFKQLSLRKQVAREVIDPAVKKFIEGPAKVDMKKILVLQSQALAALSVLEEDGTIDRNDIARLMNAFPQTQDELLQFSAQYGFLSPEQRQQRRAAKQAPVDAGTQRVRGRVTPERFDVTAPKRSLRPMPAEGQMPVEESLEELSNLTDAQLLARVNELAEEVDAFNQRRRDALEQASISGRGSVTRRNRNMRATSQQISEYIKKNGNPTTRFQRVRKLWEAKTGRKYKDTPYARQRSFQNVASQYKLQLNDANGNQRSMQGDLQRKAMQMDSDHAEQENREKYGRNAPRWMWDKNYRATPEDQLMKRRDTISRTTRGARTNLQKLGVIDSIMNDGLQDDMGSRGSGRSPSKSRRGLESSGEMQREAQINAARAQGRSVETKFGGMYTVLGAPKTRAGVRSGTQERLRNLAGQRNTNAIFDDYDDLKYSEDPRIAKAYSDVVNNFGYYNDRSGDVAGNAARAKSLLDSLRADKQATELNNTVDAPVLASAFVPLTGRDTKISISFIDKFGARQVMSFKEPRTAGISIFRSDANAEAATEAGIIVRKEAYRTGKARGATIEFTKPGTYVFNGQEFVVPEPAPRRRTPKIQKSPGEKIARREDSPTEFDL